MARVLDRLDEQLPTYRAFVAPLGGAVAASPACPLAMRFAVAPVITASVELGALVYDDEQQIMLYNRDGGLSPAFRHTSTTTATSTASQDRSGPDSDTDASDT